MRDTRCVCRSCGNTFLWTHEERMAAINSFEPNRAMGDTQSFKIETGRMKKPVLCGACKVRKSPSV